MNYDDYYEGYRDFLAQIFPISSHAYADAVYDAEEYDPDEWDYRTEYRAYLSAHPAIEFRECETVGAQGVCQVAGTFCDHTMTTH